MFLIFRKAIETFSFLPSQRKREIFSPANYAPLVKRAVKSNSQNRRRDIHLDNPEIRLAHGKQPLRVVVNLSADKTDAACPMSGSGRTGKKVSFGRMRILDIQVDGCAIESGLQLGKNGPGHGRVHKSKENTPMGLTGKGLAKIGFRLQTGPCEAVTGLFNPDTDGIVKGVIVQSIHKFLGYVHIPYPI